MKNWILRILIFVPFILGNILGLYFYTDVDKMLYPIFVKLPPGFLMLCIFFLAGVFALSGVLYFLLRQLFVLADFVKKWPFNTLGLFLAGFICPYSFFIIMTWSK